MGEAAKLMPGEDGRRERAMRQMAAYIASLLPAERDGAHHVLELSADVVDHFIFCEAGLGALGEPASAPPGIPA